MKSPATAATPLVRSQNVQASSRRRFFDYRRLFYVGIRHEFLGPFLETLVNGDEGHRFLSKAPIALANISTARWSLQGRRRARMTRDAMLVERLPVPAASDVCLLTADERELLGVDDGVCAEMFVYVCPGESDG